MISSKYSAEGGGEFLEGRGGEISRVQQIYNWVEGGRDGEEGEYQGGLSRQLRNQI